MTWELFFQEFRRPSLILCLATPHETGDDHTTQKDVIAAGRQLRKLILHPILPLKVFDTAVSRMWFKNLVSFILRMPDGNYPFTPAWYPEDRPDDVPSIRVLLTEAQAPFGSIPGGALLLVTAG